MLGLDLSNIEIQKTLLSGIFSTFNTILAVFAANLIGQTIANRKKLQEKLQQAIDDIEFLLQVEKAHCENNRETLGESRKNRVRQAVRNDGFKFSGQFTPGRVENNKFQ